MIQFDWNFNQEDLMQTATGRTTDTYSPRQVKDI